MAYLEERNGRFRITFHHDGRQRRVPLGKVERAEAEGCLFRVEEALRLLARGRIEIPPDADLGLFLLTDGKVTGKPPKREPPPPVVTLGQLRDEFVKAQSVAVEENTLYTIRIHFKHLVTSLGSDFDLSKLTLKHLDKHVARRLAMPGKKGRPMNPDTIRKEISTLGSAWEFGRPRGMVNGSLPAVGLVYPKTRETAPFRTRAEIVGLVERGADVTDAWESLYLTLDDVDEVLEIVRNAARADWLYPMVVFAAHTGARRAEMLRSRREDIDFRAGVVVVREKKKERGRLTTRRVPLTPMLADVLTGWFTAQHPGGPWTFAHPPDVERRRKDREPGEPITVKDSDGHLYRSLGKSQWNMVTWHTFRHSFASNCAARGVDERLIDGWLGHCTEAMRRRYRHLLPDHQSQAIRDVFPKRQ